MLDKGLARLQDFVNQFSQNLDNIFHEKTFTTFRIRKKRKILKQTMSGFRYQMNMALVHKKFIRHTRN